MGWHPFLKEIEHLVRYKVFEGKYLDQKLACRNITGLVIQYSRKKHSRVGGTMNALHERHVFAKLLSSYLFNMVNRVPIDTI